MNKHKVLIVGTGPAGYAAATYTGRAEIKTVVFAGSEPGGQLMKTTEVENYPGFAQGIVGPTLMNEMSQQAMRFGAEIVWETIVKLESKQKAGFVLTTETGTTHEADAVILSMGAKSKLLGVGEDKYWGKGFSTCAVCDAAFYKGKNVYVVGGGDAAVEDAVALTKFATHVTMLVRGTELRASKIMQRRVLDNPNVTVMWKTNLKEIRGETVRELVLDVDGVEQTVAADGLFYAIGHEPATGWLAGSDVRLDSQGYALTGMTGLMDESGSMNHELWIKGYPTMTSVPGIFAAGDCVDFRYRQAATAAGMGVAAALDAEKWLNSQIS